MDKVLLDKVMRLSPRERTIFAELILESIDSEEEEIKQTWINEVKARMEAVREGRSKLLNFDTLFNED